MYSCDGLMTSTPNQITISLDSSIADSILRRRVEALAEKNESTISAIGRAALGLVVDSPHLIESRIERRWAGRSYRKYGDPA